MSSIYLDVGILVGEFGPGIVVEERGWEVYLAQKSTESVESVNCNHDR